MKISKSKRQLARLIIESEGWLGGEFAVQNGNCGRISFSKNKPSRQGSTSWMAVGGFNFRINGCERQPNWHQTVLTRAEFDQIVAESAEQSEPDADGWIEWKSKFYGDIPCDESCIVDIMESDGEIFTDFMAKNWKHWGSVKAYRLHNPEQAKPRFCESVMRSIPEYEIHSKNMDITQVDDINVVESKPTIEQLAADYRNAKYYAERKQQEADAAKADAEAKLAELIAAGKEVGLVLSVAAPEPELVITDWRDLRVGDIIECVDGRNKDRVGMVGRIDGFDLYNTNTDRHVRMVSDNGQVSWPTKWHFIRRP